MERTNNLFQKTWGTIPVKTFSSLKPSTFHILTVLSDDAVARYLLTKYIREMMEEACHAGGERERVRNTLLVCGRE